jgi:catechol 2,3-dioxygenase-like lactoylglutathione lyase family enzyme
MTKSATDPMTEPMTEPSQPRLTLLVLYSAQLEQCRRFYSDLGLTFTAEQHGQGPEHYAAVLPDGAVFELYPARPGRQTDILRLGLAVPGDAAVPPMAPGRHILTDPDGRAVEIRAS